MLVYALLLLDSLIHLKKLEKKKFMYKVCIVQNKTLTKPMQWYLYLCIDTGYHCTFQEVNKELHQQEFCVHRQTSYRDKPPNATNILRDKRTKDKRTKGTSLK